MRADVFRSRLVYPNYRVSSTEVNYHGIGLVWWNVYRDGKIKFLEMAKMTRKPTRSFPFSTFQSIWTVSERFYVIILGEFNNGNINYPRCFLGM